MTKKHKVLRKGANLTLFDITYGKTAYVPNVLTIKYCDGFLTPRQMLISLKEML